MSDDDIDLDRVISDPAYRRRVIEYLNVNADTDADAPGNVTAQLSGGRTADHGKSV